MNGPRLSAWVWLGLAVCAVSSGSIFARLSGAPSVLIAFGRCLLAALFFSGWLLVRRPAPLRTEDRKRVVAAGLALGVHLGAWIASLKLTTVGVSVLLVNTTPIWTLLARRSAPSGRDLLATGLGFLGCAIAVSGALGGQSSWLGVVLALVGAVAMAVYVLVGQDLVQRVDLVQYVAGCYGTAASLLVIAALAMRPPMAELTWSGFGWIVAMTVFAQIVGHTLVNRSLGFIAPHRVTLALMLEPLLASVAAWMVFGEALTWQLAVAFPLVLGGVGLVVGSRKSDIS
ncbi:MAG: hypothetical protein BGO01_00180 [Armatimonadetes bacterium 55-13]|nr:DMT family transporter [Armatimonadota bacterium]OJU63118.1 MAG: hypothetical protein BGO01_00180 [Armatimonadetes bacterium 55-13]